MPGACAACAFAADQVAAVSVPRPADSHGGRLWATACQPAGLSFSLRSLLGRHDQPIVCFWPQAAVGGCLLFRRCHKQALRERAKGTSDHRLT